MATNPKPATLSAGGYVHPGRPVKLYVNNLFEWVREVTLVSNAFAEDRPYTTTITTDPSGRVAVGEVLLGDVDAGAYPVTVAFGFGLHATLYVHVEDAHPAPITTLLTAADDQGMLNLTINGLTINGATGTGRTQVAVDGEDWFAVLYQRGASTATASIVRSKNVEPGKTYPLDVKIEFYGGHTETVSGTVLVPAAPVPPPVKGQLPTVIHHVIDTNRLGGKAETIEHRVEFGDAHAQPNARYGVSHELVVASHNGGKPDLPADIRAALRELKPFTVARSEDHVVLIGGNPKILAKNRNFRIKLLVTITPVETGGGGTVGNDDAPDWTTP